MNEITPVQAAKPEIIRIVKLALEPEPRACEFIRPVIALARECRRQGFRLPLNVYLCGDAGADGLEPPWRGEFLMNDRRDGQGLVIVEFLGDFGPDVELPAFINIFERGDRRAAFVAIGIDGEHDAVLAAARREMSGSSQLKGAKS